MDYAAATPMHEDVRLAMEPYFSEKFYNPSANYLASRKIKEEIVRLKKSIAEFVGAKHTEIIHTSGGTEANNLAIDGVMELFPKKKILTSSVEHESVLNPAAKYNSKQLAVDKNGLVQLDKLQEIIDDETVLISIMFVNNETGTIQPIKKISEIVHEINRSRLHRGVETPLYFHTDACQAPGFLDIHASRLGVDMMTLNGGKIYGPKGSGILFVKTGVRLTPQMLGGGQQRNLRSGTENPSTLAGFAKALEITAGKRTEESDRLEKIRQKFIDGLIKINGEIVINGHKKSRTPHILSVTFPGVDNERLLFQLDEVGIMAASGSACSASSEDPSHVLGAMGLSEQLARSTLRFSFGQATTEKDVDHVVDKLNEFLN